MLAEMQAKINPQVVKTIKITAVVVGAALAVTAVGVVLYKTGLFNGQTAEEAVEAALDVAAL